MEYLDNLGQRAVAAKYVLQELTTDEKNRALRAAAAALTDGTERILEANRQDYGTAEANGMSAGLLDRLKLTAQRIHSMAEGLLLSSGQTGCRLIRSESLWE